jgi:transaldolase
MRDVKSLKIKIFGDGANMDDIRKAYKEGIVRGFTTNPTLMRKAGVTDYEKFAREALAEITDMPFSFEVFSDDFASMEREARKIASWAKNVVVKIPITNTKGESALPLIKKLSHEGMALNITAILPVSQVADLAKVLHPKSTTFVSVFAGRVADTGRDPVPHMIECLGLIKHLPGAELLWASPRELLNIFQAEDCGCHIITVAHDILKKLSLVGKDMDQYSLETVKMFYNDACQSGFKLI